jgi:hypothetical protein
MSRWPTGTSMLERHPLEELRILGDRAAQRRTDMDDYPLLDIFFTMLWLYILIAWFYFLVVLATDIFRSRDLSGVGKALWVLFLIFVPVIAAVVYLIVRGDKMHARQAQDLEAREEALRQRFGGSSASTADEISKLAELRDAGALTEIEFQAQKVRLLDA